MHKNDQRQDTSYIRDRCLKITVNDQTVARPELKCEFYLFEYFMVLSSKILDWAFVGEFTT